ncbi:MAG: type II toxin-antitoxin system ParD family antitoxin [Edaphobacter sp.]
MNISMASEFEKFVDEKVGSGDYSSASEVIRAGLRLLKERDAEHQARLEALRRDVGDGIAQLTRGDSKAGDEAFAQLRAKRKSAKRK